jgi:hypothetical protein
LDRISRTTGRTFTLCRTYWAAHFDEPPAPVLPTAPDDDGADEPAVVVSAVAERPPPTVTSPVERLTAVLVCAPDGPPALVAG